MVTAKNVDITMEQIHPQPQQPTVKPPPDLTSFLIKLFLGVDGLIGQNIHRILSQFITDKKTVDAILMFNELNFIIPTMFCDSIHNILLLYTKINKMIKAQVKD